MDSTGPREAIWRQSTRCRSCVTGPRHAKAETKQQTGPKRCSCFFFTWVRSGVHRLFVTAVSARVSQTQVTLTALRSL
eukprot:4423264-Prymnesium_polylepis.1